MAEDRSALRRHAMLLGTYMGVFWALKFILFPVGMGSPVLMLLFVVLTCAVPFMGYRYVRLYRDGACGGLIGFGHAWWFTVQMYLYASLLTAVAHYIYFAFIDGGAIADAIAASIEQVRAAAVPGTDAYLQTMDEALAQLRSMSATDMTVQRLCQNLFVCILIAVPTALFAARKEVKSGRP